MQTVFVGLGGNIGQSAEIITLALEKIKKLAHIYDFKCSNFYKTTPVSPIAQNDYINAVCSLKTDLKAEDLLIDLQSIEKFLGKVSKPKDAPRIIDLDILFFGEVAINNKTLVIPHPKWQNRLFVLIPLLDLVKTITLPHNKTKVSIQAIINNLRKESSEKVEKYEKSAC